ncbi:hypothetical protein J3R83DRAFT_1387 [Lanmaoa asiatica]|nr:hypothetical protein J3R83DRAFT_1387 [Lanmaoa asiatica]
MSGPVPGNYYIISRAIFDSPNSLQNLPTQVWVTTEWKAPSQRLSPTPNLASEILTLSPTPELCNPNLLNILIPTTEDALALMIEAAPNALNSVMHSLRTIAHRRFTSLSTFITGLGAYMALRAGFSRDLRHHPEYQEHPRKEMRKGPFLQSVPNGCWKELLSILALATVEELDSIFFFKQRPDFLHNHYCESRARPIERYCRKYERLTHKPADRCHRVFYVVVSRLFLASFEMMVKLATLPADAAKGDWMTLIDALPLSVKWGTTPGLSYDRVTSIASAIWLLLRKAQVSSPITRWVAFFIATGS